jgi:flagellar basal body-associated protein FliL
VIAQCNPYGYFMKKFLSIIFLYLLFTTSFAFAKAELGGDAKKDSGTVESSGVNFYIRLNPMVLPVINEHGVTEIVSMLIALEVSDQRAIESVNGIIPRLNDAIVRALYGQIDKSIYRNGRFLDINKLKTKLEVVTDKTLGKGFVKNVLIQGVNQRAYN